MCNKLFTILYFFQQITKRKIFHLQVKDGSRFEHKIFNFLFADKSKFEYKPLLSLMVT